jgi:UDP-glucose 4-epimerase
MHHRIQGLHSVVVRPSNIYGPGQIPFRGQGLVATALGLAYTGKALQVFGSGNTIRDYLYIDDFCKALLKIIEFGGSGETYNIGSGVGVTINELIGEINGILGKEGRKLLVEHLPERPFDVPYNVLNSVKLRSICKWQPETNLSAGIVNTWQWVKAYLSK